MAEALRILKNAVRKKENVSVGLVGNCADLIPELAERAENRTAAQRLEIKVGVRHRERRRGTVAVRIDHVVCPVPGDGRVACAVRREIKGLRAVGQSTAQ